MYSVRSVDKVTDLIKDLPKYIFSPFSKHICNLLHHTQLFCCLTPLFEKKSYWESVKRCLHERRRRWIKPQFHLLLDSHFETILHDNPVMWKSLGIGWNWWPVLHRRRLGGLGGLERSWPSAKEPCHKSGPMNSEWGLSSPWRTFKKITTKFNLVQHLSPSSLLLYHKIFLLSSYNGWVSGQSRVEKFWFSEKEITSWN